MWVIVTCDNKDVCQQTLNSAGEVEGNNLVVVNGGSDDYEGLVVPKGWEVLRVSETKGYHEILNSIFNLFPDEAYYGVIPENVIVQSVDWDEKIKSYSKNRYIVNCDDGNMESFPFTGMRIWPGDLVRKIGYWGIPNLHTAGFDQGWIKIAWDVVLFERCLDVKLAYIPKLPSNMDTEAEKYKEQDKEVFDSWRKTEYYKTFRKLQFGGDKWRGRTNFTEGDKNGTIKDKQADASAQENGNGRQAL